MALVDMHSSWLVVNSIVGCTNACKYCLLQDSNNNLCSPKILGTPEQAIDELLNFKYYNQSLPLCLFPNTDIFLNESNIEYLMHTLDELDKNNIQNDLILITKCLIPFQVLSRLKQIQDSGRNVVVYLSYSGLGKDIEPNVNHEDIRQNFDNLHKLGIPIVHYYRPFIPQNSEVEKIKETLAFVHQYTPVSATMGLMYVPTMLDKQNFWEELKNVDIEKLKGAISIWPEDAWNYFYSNYDSEQYFYQTNTCALNTILERPSTQYYGTYECENFNNCDPEQRKRCQKCFKQVDKEETISNLNQLLEHLDIVGDYDYTFDNNNGLQITGLQLDVKTLSYLSYLLGVKVYVPNGRALNDIYNSTLNGAKPLVLRRSLANGKNN